MTGLQVLAAAFPVLLQDAGRYGWQHLGVGPGGPLDLQAAAWANHLLGNPWGTPLLEIPLGGLQLQAGPAVWLAFCGADMPLQVAGVAQPGWSAFPLPAGQVLQVGLARSGQRGYLAVAGGFQGAAMLGSVATQCREQLGGLRGDGRPVRPGDWLPCHCVRRGSRRSVPWRWRPDYRQPLTLRVIMGGDAARFSGAALAQFFAGRWQLSARSDRMGARLQGEPLAAPVRHWSLGVSSGAIQVPPDGQPLILQADRQTMGGYPLLGWVYPRDLWRLAQLPAHRSLGFRPGPLAEAQQELRQFYRFFQGS